MPFKHSVGPEPDDSIKYKYIVFSQQRLNSHSQDEVLFKVFEDLTEAREYALEQAMDKLRFTYRVYRLVPEHAYWMESIFYSYFLQLPPRRWAMALSDCEKCWDNPCTCLLPRLKRAAKWIAIIVFLNALFWYLTH